MPTTDPIPVPNDVPSINEFKDVCRSRGEGQTFLRGTSRTLFSGRNPELASEGSETLDALVVAGNTTLAVTTVRGESGLPRRVDLIALPVGVHSGQLEQMHSSSVVASIDVPALGVPDETGVVQGSKTITIGREDIRLATGNIPETQDTAISKGHLDFKVDDQGNVVINDNDSKNGTSVVSGQDLLTDESVGGLGRGEREVLADYIKPLAQETSLWASDARSTTPIVVVRT